MFKKIISYISKKIDRKLYSRILKKIDSLSLTDLDERRRNNIFNYHRNDYKFDKKQIVLIHTPKTGGSSVRNILENTKSDLFYRWKKESLHNPVSLICSPSKEYKYITFLRHPVQRVFSYYMTSLNHKNTTRHSIAKRSLADLLINCWEVKNLYCQYISGFVKEAVNEDIYNIAKKNLEKFFFVGQFEKFDDSVKQLCNKLEVKLDYLPHVVLYSKTSHMPLNEDQESIIKKYNEYDIKLYNEFFNN